MNDYSYHGCYCELSTSSFYDRVTYIEPIGRSSVQFQIEF